MSESNVNIPLLRKAVEWAEAEAAKPPELCEWEQAYFILPTSPADPNLQGWGPNRTHAQHGKAADCGTCFCIAGRVMHESGEAVPYFDAELRAVELLGIDLAGAERLFDGDNTIQDVRRIAEDIAGERL